MPVLIHGFGVLTAEDQLFLFAILAFESVIDRFLFLGYRDGLSLASFSCRGTLALRLRDGCRCRRLDEASRQRTHIDENVLLSAIG